MASRKTKNMNKPALFVGSSSEGLEFARAVRALLDEDAEVTLWKEGLFDVGSTFIDSLIKALPRFDFAALILTGDDLLTSREATTLGPRDNVLFELGLFMGRLGRERTFVIRARGDQVKIPSDLAGLTTATYDWPRADRNHQAAVGPACDNIRKMIHTLGFAETRTSVQIRAVQEEQARQGTDLQTILRFLLQNFISGYELVHLQKLATGEPFPFKKSDTFEKELRRLLSLGLIARRPNRGIRSLFSSGDDVRNHLEITDRGKWYLTHLADLEKAGGEP
jgi:Predicted nucleotide-binding protein containing TIR-like domain